MPPLVGVPGRGAVVAQSVDGASVPIDTAAVPDPAGDHSGEGAVAEAERPRIDQRIEERAHVDAAPDDVAVLARRKADHPAVDPIVEPDDVVGRPPEPADHVAQ